MEHQSDGVELAIQLANRIKAAQQLNPKSGRSLKVNEGEPVDSATIRKITETENTVKVPKVKRRIRTRQADFQTLGDAVQDLIVDRGWSKATKLPLVMAKWRQIVGTTVASHTEVRSFKNSVVYVTAESTPWAVQLRNIAPQIVAKLNAELGDGTVTRIVVKGPNAPSWQNGRRRVTDGRGQRDTYG